jgi:chloride channel protein, CIC family
VTLGSGGSGGVFAPSLFIGAAVGGAFGVAVNLLFPSMTAPYPAYALVGMAAVFSAASRATLTSIIMLFEMTRDYNIILPLMFACVVADIVAWLISKNTIYTEKLIHRGLHVHQDLEANVLHARHIADVMCPTVETLHKDVPIREVWERIVETGHQGFPIVNDENRLVGVVTGREVMRAIHHGNEASPIGGLIQRSPIIAYPDETLDVAWDRMGCEGVGRLPVMSREDPNRLIGILTRGDLIRFRKTLK